MYPEGAGRRVEQSEALYFELAPFGIRVKMVEPGYGPQTEFTANAMAAADGNSITLSTTFGSHDGRLVGLEFHDRC